MIETVVRELSDGEEMVIEGVVARHASDDPRERTLEARRQAFDQPSRSEYSKW